MQSSITHTIRIFLYALLLTSFCSAANLAIWQNRWKISGRVTDKGRPIAGAVVKATNTENKETREILTDEDGIYLLTNLQRGSYRVKVYLRGYLVYETEEFVVGPALRDRFDFELNIPGPIAEILPSKIATPHPNKSPVPPPTITPKPAATDTLPSAASPSPSISSSPTPAQTGPGLDEILKNLPVGNIAFNTPTEMRLNETVSIELPLSPTKAIEELRDVVKEPGGIETAQIKISEFMEAKIVGSGFEITPVTPTRQFVSKTEDTFWRWDVKAVRPGRQRLTLSLNIILEDEGDEIVRPLRIFSKDIDIEVAFSERVKEFVGENWQWLWTMLVLPIAAWLWRRYSARKQSDRLDQ